MKSLLSDEVVAVRGVLTDKHRVDFHVLGVTGAIYRLTLPLRECGTVVHLETPHHGMEVDRQSATLLYRAAQEPLSNVYKFAQASGVTVRLGGVTQGMSHGVQLKVTDDGVGFDVPAAMIGRHTGMGLRLMRVAVVLAGGEMIIDSSAAAGTYVEITLPLDQRRLHRFSARNRLPGCSRPAPGWSFLGSPVPGTSMVSVDSGGAQHGRHH